MSGHTADTVRFQRVRMPARHRARDQEPTGGFWRGLAGALAVGLVLLAVALLGAEALASDLGVDGPGSTVVLTHSAAAVLALIAVRVADRAHRVVAATAVSAVLLLSAATLWWFWWS